MEKHERRYYTYDPTLVGLATDLRVQVEKNDEFNTNKTISQEMDGDIHVLVMYSFDDQSKRWPTKLLDLRPELLPYTPFHTKTSVTKPELEEWIELVIGTPDDAAGMDYSEWQYEAGE